LKERIEIETKTELKTNKRYAEGVLPTGEAGN